MDGYEYENKCAEYLRNNGFSCVEVTKYSGDQGVDITAFKNGIKYAFQCKYYNSPVGIKAIQEVFSGMHFYDCQRAVVITNNEFTQQAIKFSKKLDVELWDAFFPVITHSYLSEENIKPRRNDDNEFSINQFGENYVDYCMSIIEDKGFKVEVVDNKTSEMIDFIASNEEIKYAVRCSYYFDTKMSGSIVSETRFDKNKVSCDRVLIVTNETFSSSDYYMADILNVDLLGDIDPAEPIVVVYDNDHWYDYYEIYCLERNLCRDLETIRKHFNDIDELFLTRVRELDEFITAYNGMSGIFLNSSTKNDLIGKVNELLAVEKISNIQLKSVKKKVNVFCINGIVDIELTKRVLLDKLRNHYNSVSNNSIMCIDHIDKNLIITLSKKKKSTMSKEIWVHEYIDYKQKADIECWKQNSIRKADYSIGEKLYKSLLSNLEEYITYYMYNIAKDQISSDIWKYYGFYYNLISAAFDMNSGYLWLYYCFDRQNHDNMNLVKRELSQAPLVLKIRIHVNDFSVNGESIKIHRFPQVYYSYEDSSSIIKKYSSFDDNITYVNRYNFIYIDDFFIRNTYSC